MKEHIKMMIDKNISQQENIIKEIAEQGYDYLIMKQEIVYERTGDGISAKVSHKYKGSNVLENIPDGYEIYDLLKVKEYLNKEYSSLKE